MYFPDEQFSFLQGRINVRQASIVRVTGEAMGLEDKPKGTFFDDHFGGIGSESPPVLVWIAQSSTKMFVLKV